MTTVNAAANGCITPHAFAPGFITPSASLIAAKPKFAAALNGFALFIPVSHYTASTKVPSQENFQ